MCYSILYIPKLYPALLQCDKVENSAPRPPRLGHQGAIMGFPSPSLMGPSSMILRWPLNHGRTMDFSDFLTVPPTASNQFRQDPKHVFSFRVTVFDWPTPTDSIWHMSDTRFGVLFGIYSANLSEHSIWFYLTYIQTFYLAFFKHTHTYTPVYHMIA